MALVAVNLSGQAQEGATLEVPLDLLEGAGEERYFVLFEMLTKKLYFYTRDQLERLKQDLGPWERRVYLVRALANPNRTLQNVFENSSGFPGQGITLAVESDRVRPSLPSTITPPWLDRVLSVFWVGLGVSLMWHVIHSAEGSLSLASLGWFVTRPLPVGQPVKKLRQAA